MNINMTVSAPSRQTLQQNAVFSCDVKCDVNLFVNTP